MKVSIFRFVSTNDLKEEIEYLEEKIDAMKSEVARREREGVEL